VRRLTLEFGISDEMSDGLQVMAVCHGQKEQSRISRFVVTRSCFFSLKQAFFSKEKSNLIRKKFNREAPTTSKHYNSNNYFLLIKSKKKENVFAATLFISP
jgi:hypothetical protein